MEQKRFRILYRDASEGSVTFSMTVTAYDRAHAAERFDDSDDDGWQIVNVTEIRQSGQAA